MPGPFVVLRVSLDPGRSDEQRRELTEALYELRESVPEASRSAVSSDELILLVDTASHADQPPAVARAVDRVIELLSRHGIDESNITAVQFPDMEKVDAMLALTADLDIRLFLDPGEAPPQVVARVLQALSNLQRASGGEGLIFRTDGELVIPASAGVR